MNIKSKKGMTLVEVIATVAIMAVINGTLFHSYSLLHTVTL